VRKTGNVERMKKSIFTHGSGCVQKPLLGITEGNPKFRIQLLSRKKKEHLKSSQNP